MASGFGFGGGRSRCFADWQEFMQCYSKAERPTECISQRADYLECLHHTKEIARAKVVKEHFLARSAREAKEARESGEVRATSSILRLGLIPKDKESSSDGGSSSGSSEGSASPSKDE